MESTGWCFGRSLYKIRLSGAPLLHACPPCTQVKVDSKVICAGMQKGGAGRISEPASVMRLRMCSKCLFVSALRVPDMDTESLMTLDAPGPARTELPVQDYVSGKSPHNRSAMQASSRTTTEHARTHCRAPPVLNSLTETTALSVGEVSRDTSGCSATTTCSRKTPFGRCPCMSTEHTCCSPPKQASGPRRSAAMHPRTTCGHASACKALPPVCPGGMTGTTVVHGPAGRLSLPGTQL